MSQGTNPEVVDEPGTDPVSGSPNPGKPVMGRAEFIGLMAAMAALDAFSIDAMLPALSQMGADLGLTNENHRQYVIIALFSGFSVGVLIYGFIADQVGRRKPVVAGFMIYCVGSVLCIVASNFPVLLAGRVLQGLGAAGPYVLSVAIVRDSFQGRDMAQILSLIMMIFIGVPIVAPFIGQGIMLWAGWRSIFIVLTVFGLVTLLWFWRRQPETLKPVLRTRLSVASIAQVVVEVLTNRQTLSYLIGLGAVSGAFIAYLSTGQQIFQDIYGLGSRFPIAFASLATTFGIASFANSRWVQSAGSAVLVNRALCLIMFVSLIYLLMSVVWQDSPPLWSYILYMAFVMFSFGLLFGNMTTLALDPMGHIAGSASSLVNSLSTIIAIVLATLIGSQLEQNVYPVVTGFGFLSAVAWVLNYLELRRRQSGGY